MKAQLSARERNLEYLFERRARRWCRLCMSDSCSLHESPSSESEDLSRTSKVCHHQRGSSVPEEKKTSPSGDMTNTTIPELPEDFHQRFQTFKDKRTTIVNFLECVERFSASVELKLLRRMYFGPQCNGLPAWLKLIGKQNRSLTFPLVPLFRDNEKLASYDDNKNLIDLPKFSDECNISSSRLHRIRLVISTTNALQVNSPANKAPSATSFRFMEEISYGNPKLSFKFSEDGSCGPDEFEKKSVFEALSREHSSSSYRGLEELVRWQMLYYTKDAYVEACHLGRIVIRGCFLDQSHRKTSRDLNFTFFLFPKLDEGKSNTLKVHGRFVRESALSGVGLSLSWRYLTEFNL